MAVLVTARIPGPQADADTWHERNKTLPSQEGFLFQADGPVADGWRIVSAWESQEDFKRYFDAEVRPGLPPGMDPDAGMQVEELAQVITG